MFRFFLAFFLGSVFAGAAVGETTLVSKPGRVHLLELFTSEGCSSCPPAEAWLSKLREAPGLWIDFVPLAFHVDYWDRLGWRDPFAAPAWTARQYAYSARWKSRSVYTPAFVLNGREWQNRGVPAASTETVGVLKAAFDQPDRVAVSFQPGKSDGRALEAHVARLGFDVRINVRAGENNGRQLQHDFVVLAHAQARLSDGVAEVSLPAISESAGQIPRHALVAWITEAGEMEPLQAVGGWLR